MLLNKWRLTTNQDQEILANNFKNVNLDIIKNNILQALNIYFSPFSCLKRKALRFIDVIDNLDLTIKLIDNCQLIIHSKNEKMKNSNECIVKKKARLNNFHAFMQALTASFAAFLLFYLAFIFSFRSSTFLLLYLRSSTLLLFFFVFILLFYLVPALLSHFMPILISLFLVVLLFFFEFCLIPSYLAFSIFKTCKQVLSKKFPLLFNQPCKAFLFVFNFWLIT